MCIRDRQLEAKIAETSRLTDDSLAKTQQVKQYKKQVDNFRAQLQESNARAEEYHAKLEQYQRELTYCQRDLQKREEDEESKVSNEGASTLHILILISFQAELVRAKYESEISTLDSELGRVRREKADIESQLRLLQKGMMMPETSILFEKLEREKTELKHKYTQLRDRFDVSLSLIHI